MQNLVLILLGQVKDWVIEQTRERIKRQLEADELAYQKRLLAARKREEVMRRAARARVLKKPVWFVVCLPRWLLESLGRNGAMKT
jgi:hypothetical protein